MTPGPASRIVTVLPRRRPTPIAPPIAITELWRGASLRFSPSSVDSGAASVDSVMRFAARQRRGRWGRSVSFCPETTGSRAQHTARKKELPRVLPPPAFGRFNPSDVLFVRQRDGFVLASWIRSACIYRVGLGPEVSQHVVAGSRLPLVPQRRQVHRRDDDPLAGSGRRLRPPPT